MAKFHVNPETGVPGECTANNGRCPFGSPAAHGDTMAAAIQNFEKSFVAVPLAKSKLSSDAAREAIDDYSAAIAKRTTLLDELRGARMNGASKDTLGALQRKYTATYTEADEALALVEDVGLGHMVPDDGPTIRVASKEQKILLKDSLIGQISDGKWENTQPHDHWEVWAKAEIIVDPKNVGRNFNAIKDNYQLNSSELMDIIGDEMVESVQAGTSNASYDATRMGHDLKGLRKIFKTPRKTHKASEANVAPVSAGSSGKLPTGPSDWSVAVKGPGSKNHPESYSGTNIGYSSHTDHAGDMVVVAAQADGKRVRMMVKAGDEFTSPEAMMGQPFTHVKHTKNGSGTTSGLHIVGIKSKSGAITGWMPNKNTQTFTLDGI